MQNKRSGLLGVMAGGYTPLGGVNKSLHAMGNKQEVRVDD